MATVAVTAVELTMVDMLLQTVAVVGPSLVVI